ncbi:Polysaccharide chain length determinant N-terminal domain containing protein [Candidatus Methylopumilus universalis]|uniref:Wzz/FepE/Etk N-terminal domain-containing protein n=1 Tax=Candidatus Methylopumilus universalis TaxID=2588536 RepID=UPI003BEEBF0E
MAPPAAPKNQMPFDDEISLLDIIQFFKTHFKRILFFIILGGILGYLYGKLAPPVYDGIILISPAKVAGVVVVDPKITLTKLDINSYYPKETFLACNPMFYKDKGKEIDYNMSDIIKNSITKDGNLIEIKMRHSNKETIHACLENIAMIINASQKIITGPLIESKKNELNLAETKLKLAEEFKQQLNGNQIKNLKSNEQRFSADMMLYANIIFNGNPEVKMLLDQINKVKTELSSEQTKDVGQVLPISIERKSFPSPKLGLLLGLFLGSVLGFFISIFKNMKTN